MGDSEESNKYSYWVFTVSPTNTTASLPEIEVLTKTLTDVAEKWIFQKEEATSVHYQGSLKTKYRIRHRTLLDKIQESLGVERAMITISRAQGSWDQCIAYCSKTETRVEGPFVSDPNVLPYAGEDINFLKEESNRYPWQKKLMSYLSLRRMRQILRILMIAKSYGLPISKVVLEKASSLSTFLTIIMVFQNFRSARRTNSDQR